MTSSDSDASRRIAVAIVHGMGPKDPDFADDTIAALQERLAEHLDDVDVDEPVAFQPVYWSEVPHDKEEQLWERVNEAGDLGQTDLRRYLLNLLGDTLAYQPSEGRRELYLEVHRRIRESFGELADAAGADAPLCVVAHSLGTVVAHNYIYDMQNDPERAGDLERPERPIERGATLALFCTYGSPIAIWRLRFGDDYKAIEFPGPELGKRYPQLEPRWYNVWDPDDVIAYPIATLTERYRQLADAGMLVDVRRQVGGLLTNWNPLSHREYFDDDDVLDELAQWLASVWRGAYGEGETDGA